MDRSERDRWNLEHRCCGACDHWKVWEEDERSSELRRGDCDRIEAGTEYGISDDGKTIFTYDGYSFEDECYDECLHCFEERKDHEDAEHNQAEGRDDPE